MEYKYTDTGSTAVAVSFTLEQLAALRKLAETLADNEEARKACDVTRWQMSQLAGACRKAQHEAADALEYRIKDIRKSLTDQD